MFREEDFVDYESYEDELWVRKDSLPNLDIVRDHVKGILEQVYETGDIFMLEFNLDEICAELNIAPRMEAPVIAKAESKTLNEWEKEICESIVK